jgi:hypothetical protein
MWPMPRQTLPDFHFLLIASNLGAEWFFEAARDYWERFQPTVISDLGLVSLLPEDVSIAVTVIARRDRIAQIGVDLSKIAPDALFDPVVHDFLEDTQQALIGRAQRNEPFGVPLIPTATPTPGPTSPPVYPTPGPIGVPAAATATPTPNVPPAQEDLDDAGPPSTPLFPTPGPITGG